jgi:hypothetical protein
MSSTYIESLAALAHYCETFAKQMLSKSGAFYPFGAFINADDELEALAASTGTDRPSPSELLELTRAAVGELAASGRLKAYAIAADVNIPAAYEPPFQDGIRVQIEAPGYSRFIYTPYRVLRFRPLRAFLVVLPTVGYAQPIPVDIEPDLFEALA